MSDETNRIRQRPRTPIPFRAMLPHFETRQQTLHRKVVLIRRLIGGDDDAITVARRLNACSKHAPCESPICPACVRCLRHSFIKGGMACCIADILERGNVPGEHVVAFSGALSEEQYAVGELHKADFKKLNKRLQRRFQRAGLPHVLAGVALCLNEDSTRRWPPSWQLQVYGVVVGLPRLEVKKRIAANLPISESIPRPLKVRSRGELADALSYIIKPMFVRRVSYVDTTGPFNTRKVPIKSAEMRELAVWLDQYPLTARYLLTGCRRYGDRIELNKNIPLVQKDETANIINSTMEV
jgi:hypothetical protein